MRRRIGLAALLAVGALAIAAGPAGATGLLSLRTGGVPLAVNSTLNATSSNFNLEVKPLNLKSKAQSVTCTNATFTATLLGNGKAGDHATTGEPRWEGGGIEESKCASTDEFTVTGGYGELLLAATGVATIKFVTIVLDPPPPHETNNGVCTLTAPAIKGTFEQSETEPGPTLTVTFARAPLRTNANSGHECGLKGFISGSYTFSAGGLPVEAIHVP
jgi:hypothetical protein